jgi:hydroxyacylglutathione hydrolase
VLDVRGKTEYNEGHIPNAMNIHAGQLLDNLERIPSDRPLLVHCASGDRSSIAASLLKANGFDNVTNLTNGINGWMNSNPSLIERETEKMEEAV